MHFVFSAATENHLSGIWGYFGNSLARSPCFLTFEINCHGAFVWSHYNEQVKSIQDITDVVKTNLHIFSNFIEEVAGFGSTNWWQREPR